LSSRHALAVPRGCRHTAVDQGSLLDLLGGRARELGEQVDVAGQHVGGGFEWAINCDFPIWAESARAFFPEVSLNLFVTGAVTSLLPALVGLNTAREMLFFGDRYDAAALLRMGVAWRVVADDQLLTEAHAVASRLAALPPLAVRAMKRVLNQTASTDIRLALAAETHATVEGFMDPETTRLLQAF
jgi:enoyl-CoA hydratase/carnithine racemase